MIGKSRKMFPGANTANGFFPFFDYIIPKNVNRIFCLKGGPGVGKSSFMKKIAREFLGRGYDIELHYCSSDPSSLDGLVIKGLNVVLLDATAPHMVDPKLPGAIDEIINFGEFWDYKAIEKNREAIEKVNSQIKEYFGRTYKFLKAVEPIYLDLEEKISKSIDRIKYNKLSDEILARLFANVEFRNENPYERHLFGSAITPSGYLDYSDSTFENVKNIYYLNGDKSINQSDLLETIYKRALSKGLDVEVYHFPLLVDRLQAVYIVQLDTAITTSHLYEDKHLIDLEKCIDSNKIKEYENEINEDKEIIDYLMKNAISNLKRAKFYHDEIEQYYIPAMNFDKVEELKFKVIDKILNYQ